MKLQNMTIIFVIIILPIIVVLSYYIGLQIDTITLQNSYNTKLQEAAKDAIEALEINTIELNSEFSKLASARRRDITASINTFSTGLANSLGIGGANLERIQAYLPVMAYTMYDGYYIYSPEGENGEKILRPYSPYSARYVNGSTDVTVNYTLDNYIRVYGNIVKGGTVEYQTREGYLVVCDTENGVKKEGAGIGGELDEGIINNITYMGKKIEPETLQEQVYTADDGVTKTYTYIYDQYNIKRYWDPEWVDEAGNQVGNYFTINRSTYQKNYLLAYVSDSSQLNANTFKKISIPKKQEGEWIYIKVYQALNPGGRDKFFEDLNADGQLEAIGISIQDLVRDCGYNLVNEISKDFSAINYCVESYVFTKWVNTYLKDITVEDFVGETGQYNNVENDEHIFEINKDNNPDPQSNVDYQKSILAIHKKDVIINKMEENLARAIESAENPSYDYRLPKLNYSEWEQALSNMSVITFMQGMQIGLKYYNNYAIATSTLNREYVDPQELYFSGEGDQYYHQRTCEHANGSNYVGYRSTDHVAKSYITEVIDPEDATKTIKKTNYYYLHDNAGNTNSEYECYSCLVNVSTYKKEEDDEVQKNILETSYYNALARERYIQLDSPNLFIYEPEIFIDKQVNIPNTYINETVTYTLTLTNTGIVKDTVYLLDQYTKGELVDITIITNELNGINNINHEYLDGTKMLWQSNDGMYEGIWIPEIELEPGQEKKIVYTAKLAKLGTITNTAIVYSDVNREYDIKTINADTHAEAKVQIAYSNNTIENANVIFVVDSSWSQVGEIFSNTLSTVVNNALNKCANLYTGYNVNLNGDAIRPELDDNRLWVIKFGASADFLNINKNPTTNTLSIANLELINIFGGTDYNAALGAAQTVVRNDVDKNIIIFISDRSTNPFTI